MKKIGTNELVTNFNILIASIVQTGQEGFRKFRKSTWMNFKN